MPLPLVLIEVAPQGAAPDVQAVMVTACTQSLSQGTCALSETGPPDNRATAIAIVSWDSTEQHIARIQVGRKRGQAGSWLSREMQFRLADAPIERWRAVGFAIGTLADEQEREAERASVAPLPAPPASAPATPPVHEQAPAPWTHAPRWIAIGPLAGPGLDTGPWRYGMWLRGANQLGPTPFFAQVSASHALRPTRDQVRVQWANFAAGLGALISSAALHLELRAHTEFVAEYVRASTHDPDSGRDDSGSRWSPGFRGGIQAIWPSSRPIAAVVGADAWTLSGGTAIRMHGSERIGSSPATGFVVLLGCEVHLP
jgi:hypothetical protein